MTERNIKQRLVFCSKSRWEPQIRREHAVSSQAVERGHDVTFIELADDVRQMRRGPIRYLRGLAGAMPARDLDSVHVIERSCLVPGHRGQPWALIDSHQLARVVGKVVEPAESTSLVCFRPWDWTALAKYGRARRVFDMTDDWTTLMPHRGPQLREAYRRIATEADAIILVNPELARHFPERSPVVVPNGVSDIMLSTPPIPPTGNTLLYVGTLSERFDAPLMSGVMDVLSDWRLELVGACAYAGHGDRPNGELQALLDRNQQVRWHGPLSRENLVSVLDRASVCVIPNRAQHARGQDSMKAYDYAARGRPIVSTVGAAAGAEQAGMVTALPRADSFASAVLDASAESAERARTRRLWAERNSWDARWPAWSSAACGVGD